MKNYKIVLTRTYIVSVEAENEDLAKHYVEYYLDDCKDGSSEKERKEKQSKI